MTRIGRDKEIHDSMIRTRVNALKIANYNVKADHINSNNIPEKINGHIPDIIAIKIGEKIIVEVETAESYALQHTKEQFEAFSKIPGTKFHVVIPQSCLREAQAKAREWGIQVDLWWNNPNF